MFSEVIIEITKHLGKGFSKPTLTTLITYLKYLSFHQVIDARASKITALIRGYLTRALLNSYKAQQYVKTIRDTEEILSGYQDISGMSEQDRAFYDRSDEL